MSETSSLLRGTCLHILGPVTLRHVFEVVVLGEKSKRPTALDGGTFSAMFTECFAFSLDFGQKIVLTSFDSNGYLSGSFNKSI